MRRLPFVILLLVTSAQIHASDLGFQFVTAKLSHGASISVPRSWDVLEGNDLRSVETGAGAAMDLSGYAEVVRGAETLIVAGFPDQRLHASVTVTSTAIASVTPSLLAALPEAQIKVMDATIKQGIVASQSKLETDISEWVPLRRVRVGQNLALYTGYVRSSEYGPRRVYLYKFFGTGRVYDLVLSTSVQYEGVNDVVLESILRSFVAP